jgi:hypothetical protein
MSPAELKAWRDRYGFSNAQAAEKLALTLPGFLNQLYERRPVSRQTAKLAETLTLLWLVTGQTFPRSEVSWHRDDCG